MKPYFAKSPSALVCLSDRGCAPSRAVPSFPHPQHAARQRAASFKEASGSGAGFLHQPLSEERRLLPRIGCSAKLRLIRHVACPLAAPARTRRAGPQLQAPRAKEGRLVPLPRPSSPSLVVQNTDCSEAARPARSSSWPGSLRRRLRPWLLRRASPSRSRGWHRWRHPPPAARPRHAAPGFKRKTSSCGASAGPSARHERCPPSPLVACARHAHARARTDAARCYAPHRCTCVRCGALCCCRQPRPPSSAQGGRGEATSRSSHASGASARRVMRATKKAAPAAHGLPA